MNLYFWFFALYSVLIIPVSAQIQLRFEKRVHYQLRLHAAGVPVLKIQKNEERKKEGGMAKLLNLQQGDSFVPLLRESGILKMIHWRNFQIYMHFSCRDAAQNALLYIAARTVLTAFERICSFPLRCYVDMDFQGQGSVFAIHCIAQARMGRIIASVVRLGLAAAGRRLKQRKAEEEQHAASH